MNFHLTIKSSNEQNIEDINVISQSNEKNTVSSICSTGNNTNDGLIKSVTNVQTSIDMLSQAINECSRKLLCFSDNNEDCSNINESFYNLIKYASNLTPLIESIKYMASRM